MSPLRESAEFMFGPSMAKFIPKNTDGSTPLPYPGKAESVAFSGLGPFDFSGASVPAAVPMSVKINNVEQVSSIDISTAAIAAAVTVTELIAAITVAAFTGITASVDSRGYGELLSAGDAETEYLQVYGEAALLGEFGFGLGLKFLTIDTQQSMAFTPVNVDDENVEVVDSNGLKTAILKPGYREGVTSALVDTAVDDELKTLIAGGSYDTVLKIWVAPLPDEFRVPLSIEIVNKMYLRDTSLESEYIGAKISRAFSMAGKEDSSGDGARAFQTPNYSFSGTPYTDPETKTKYGDSSTQNYTKAAFLTLDYANI